MAGRLVTGAARPVVFGLSAITSYVAAGRLVTGVTCQVLAAGQLVTSWTCHGCGNSLPVTSGTCPACGNGLQVTGGTCPVSWALPSSHNPFIIIFGAI